MPNIKTNTLIFIFTLASILSSASTVYAEAKFRLIISNNTDSIVRITKVEYVISGSI